MIKKSIKTFFTQASITVISLINSIIINRTLGPHGKGIYSLFLLIATLFAMVAELGISTGIAYKHKKNDDDIWKTFTYILLGFWLIISTLMYITLKTLNFSFYLITIPAFYFLLTNKILNGILIGKGNIKAYNIIRIIIPLVIIIGLISIPFLSIEYTPHNIFVIYIISLIVVDAILITITLPRRLTPPSLKEISSLFSYSVKVYIANLSSYLNYRIDMLLISFFLSPEYLGWYSVSVFLIEKSIMFSTSASLVNFSLKVAEENRGNKFFNFRLINTINLFITIIISLFGYFIIKLLYGSSFIYSYIPVLILSPALLFIGIGKLISSELSGEGIVHIQMRSSFLAVITNIALNIVLIPLMDIKGAALASLISYSLNTIIILQFFIKHERIKIKEILLLSKEDIKYIRQKIGK